MTRALLVLLVLWPTLLWAGPAEDLSVCQQQTTVLTGQFRDAQQARTAYVAKLAEMLAELREQVDQAREQVRALAAELQRRQRPTPAEGQK